MGKVLFDRFIKAVNLFFGCISVDSVCLFELFLIDFCGCLSLFGFWWWMV